MFLSLDWIWTLPGPVQVQGREQGWDSLNSELRFQAATPAPHPLSCIPMATAPLPNPSPPAKIPSSGCQKSHFSSFSPLFTPTKSLLFPSLKAPGKVEENCSPRSRTSLNIYEEVAAVAERPGPDS